MEEHSIDVRMAHAGDHAAVTSLVLRLLSELYDPAEWGYSRETLAPAVRALLAEGTGYWAFLARVGGATPVGIIALNQCSAIYAFGHFGEITELYVDPGYRSAGVGAALVSAAIEFGRERGWSLLEVGAPEVPKWQRTVEFYERCGFSLVGPRLTLPLRRVPAG
jgi:GNAT superfamily N-acetyltransferase